MGQRSQIYIRIADEYDEFPKLYAKYYGWNYGERMISRARHGIEYINGYLKYISNASTKEKINKIFDVNFDMKDIMISSDIIQEWIEHFSDTYNANEYIFECIDNNDGKLFVDITKDKKIKYCFTDYNMKILSPTQYMNWDFQDWKKGEFLSEEDMEICQNNIKYINKNAKLMTQEELEEFINFDYSKQINDLAEELNIPINIENEKNENEKVAVKSGYYFWLFNKKDIPETLKKSIIQVELEGKVYDLYTGTSLEDEKKINDMFGDRMGYSISDHEIIEKEL